MINIVSKDIINENLNSIYLDLALLLGMNGEGDIPEWFAKAGTDWPIYHAIREIKSLTSTKSIDEAIDIIEGISHDSIDSRWKVFENLLLGRDCRILWLNESKYVDGRVPSPTTFEVKSLYETVGLKVVGTELPDHASMELEFLAFLSNQHLASNTHESPWISAHSLFLKKHMLIWLPKVGKQLASQSDSAWKAVGLILLSVLPFEWKPPTIKKSVQGMPFIQSAETCTLCGFCVQVCQSKALQVIEDQISTALWLSEELCTQCSKCEKICPENVLFLNEATLTKMTKKLVESPRVACTKCNQMMISKAELDYAATKLDNPDWLWVCLDCRI